MMVLDELIMPQRRLFFLLSQITCFIFLNFLSLFAYAQKANGIQVGNLWVNNAKVDGELSEWQLPLKAFNKATHIHYSIANDDKNLYLAVQTKRSGKIYSGGLTFIVNGAAITFPYVRSRDRRKRENNVGRVGPPRTFADYKEIHIANIKPIADSLVSIYNPYGIRSCANSYNKDEGRVCDYEMAIPLKFLGLSAANQILNYTIRLNGVIPTSPGGPRSRIVPIPGKSKKEMMELEEMIQDGGRVSQLSGKYILAKKP